MYSIYTKKNTIYVYNIIWLWAFNYGIGPGGLGKIQIACHRNIFGAGAIRNESLSASRAAWPLGAKSRTE